MEIKSYSQATQQLGYAVGHQGVNASDITHIKQCVQDSYNSWAHMTYNKSFLNWGLWDKRLYSEYQDLNFDFSKLDDKQDVYSQLLLYYLIRPLTKARFFNKRILDIGCGNGISLIASAQLLKANYALGIDLVHKLTTNANTNFYQENKINYLQSDAEQLPLENESVDLVINLESSHLYPQIENFFSEVERVLSPGGFFCYADIHVDNKQQAQRLETYLQSNSHLKIVLKENLTKPVQASIYQRLIANETQFYQNAKILLGDDEATLQTELPYLTAAMGLSFLPWWKIWFKNPALKQIAKDARKTYWGGKKHFYYYLLQKGTK